MEVTRVENMDTHFVHGTSETIAMSMTADSSLLHVLSDALYSDKEFAVCREYIANGWDAHSMNGNSNPIQVTVDYDEEEVIFRDYGPGISHENMGPIFGTYGASTKRDDKNQIGGFGLGSKAGYSVAETFTVTSHHNGVKTIYVASKGSEETNGFYDLQVVTRMPTEETGMEIRISVDHPDRFAQITKKLASFGHKPIILNTIRNGEHGEKFLNPLAPEVSETGLFFVFGITPYTTTKSLVYIRLGGICYPLNEKEEYQDAYEKLSNIARNSSSRLIIEAPAGEIPLSPSREALSYSPTCIQTIKKLLEEKRLAIPNQKENVNMVCNRAARRAFGEIMSYDPTFMSCLEDQAHIHNTIAQAFTEEVNKYLNDVFGEDRATQFRREEPMIFTDLFKLTTYLAFNPRTIDEVRCIGDKIKRRILKQPRLNNKALFEFVFKSDKHSHRYLDGESFFKQIYKTYRKVFGEDVLKSIKYVDRDNNKTGKPIANLRSLSTLQSAPRIVLYYRLVHRIVLYYRQSDLSSYAGKWRNSDKLPALAYRLTKKDDVHGIVTYLKAQGFTVIDLVTDENYKNPPKTEAQLNAQGRPKTTGYQLLSDSLDEAGYILSNKIETLNRQKTNEPDLVLLRENARTGPYISGIPYYRDLRPLLKYYPNAVIVSTHTTANNVSEKKGAPNLSNMRVKFSLSILKQLPLFYQERHKLVSWCIHNEYANSSLGKICGIMPMKKPKLKMGDVHEKFEDFINLGIFYSPLMQYKGVGYLRDIDDQIRKRILANHKAYRVLGALSENLTNSFFKLFEDSSAKSDLHAAIKKLYKESTK